MANSDLLGNLLLSLTQKADPQPTDDNTLIQKMIAPNDSASLEDSVSFNKLNPSTFVWGGTGFTAGWTWNAGLWK